MLEVLWAVLLVLILLYVFRDVSMLEQVFKRIK